MAGAGVGAILNFAPTVLIVPPSVHVRHVDFSAELQVLAFYQAHPEAVAGRVEAVARLSS
jgi:redox-sensing transcriptional repressor